MALFEEMKSQGNLLFRYRGILPVLFLVIGLLVFVYHRLDNEHVDLGGNYDFMCLGVGIVGLLIRIYTVGHSAKRTSGRNTREQVAGEINSTGIYSTVRHPLYVGNFFMWLAVAMLTANFWFVISFILLYWVYYERIMFAEEEYLREKFGKVYSDWAAITPAFIPDVKAWRKPKYPFNFKKVFHKEKNGIMALFVIFFVFLALGSYLLYDTIFAIPNFWIVAAIASVVYYVVIKVLIKATSLLNNY